MPVDSAEFRRILGHWTTGVSVVATTDESGRPHGLTANAVASLSLDPPLVLACIERSADMWQLIQRVGFFSISVLAQPDERVARRFAGDDQDKFVGVAYHSGATGAPILTDALAWVECTVRDIHEGGDHSIFIGDVLHGDAREGEPLVYYRGGYGRLTP